MHERDIYLFVGGPANGQRRATNGEPRFYVAELAPPRMITHAYEAQTFAEGEQRHLIYFHSSIPQGMYLAALIGGYRA